MSDEIEFTGDEEEATERWIEFEAGLAELEHDAPVTRGISRIPVAHAGVSLGQLHPELHARLERALSDSRLSKIARASSGVRTYDHQKRLYAKYGSGRAANPDYRGKDGRRGSKHMVQDAKWRYAKEFATGDYGYAVDVGFWKTPNWTLLRSVMKEYGLRLTVFRPFEPWHFELDPQGSVSTSSTVPMSVTGSGVKDVQEFLGARHANMPNTIPDPGKTDGVLGPKTEAATVAWQAYLGLSDDGVWGPATEAATGAWQAKRTSTVKKGAPSALVKEIQTYLAARHVDHPDEVPAPGSADGLFGPLAERATTGWQEVLKLTADGIWGPATWAATDNYDDAARS